MATATEMVAQGLEAARNASESANAAVKALTAKSGSHDSKNIKGPDKFSGLDSLEEVEVCHGELAWCSR